MTRDNTVANKRRVIMRSASRSAREHLASKGLTTAAAGADRIVEELFDSFNQQHNVPALLKVGRNNLRALARAVLYSGVCGPGTLDH